MQLVYCCNVTAERNVSPEDRHTFSHMSPKNPFRGTVWPAVCVTSSSSMALQPRVGLGLLYNTPPSLSIPCSVSPFVYSHLSQVRGHVIQPSRFWSSSTISIIFPGCFIVWTFHLPNVKSVLPVLCLRLVFITFRGLL